MITLIKNADCYAPRHIGMCDILVANGKIEAIAPKIDGLDAAQEVEVYDARGRITTPGFIDLHVHITGGGGEDGFSSRVPESNLSDFTKAGVTTVLGLLGTDGLTRSLENLYAKACALNEEGITAAMLTGAYEYPSPTLTGTVERDIELIAPVIGAKIAVSDSRSSEMTQAEFLRLAAMVRRGGLLSRKAGLLTVHMGDGDRMLSYFFYAMEHSDIPPKTFLPTHLARNSKLTLDAKKFMLAGGNGDFTAGEPGDGTAAVVARLIREGVDCSRMTMSSDAFGSMPAFDGEGKCIGLTFGTSEVLQREFRLLVENEHMDISNALRFFTENAAARMRLSGVKGELTANADADIVFYDEELNVDSVMARGRLMVDNKEIKVIERFNK